MKTKKIKQQQGLAARTHLKAGVRGCRKYCNNKYIGPKKEGCKDACRYVQNNVVCGTNRIN